MVPIELVYISPHYLNIGIEKHVIEGVPVNVYSLSKTIIDCFKFRNRRVGLDICIEALKEVWRDRRCTIDELWYYSKICCVQTVIRPYLEMLVN